MFNRQDIEDIILGMADLVEENRELRCEVQRLNRIVKRYDEELRNRVREQEKADKAFLKTIMENSLMGGNRNEYI